MTQLEKLLARLSSLDDGLSTIQLYYKGGELVCWFVQPAIKAEGEVRKTEEKIPLAV